MTMMTIVMNQKILNNLDKYFFQLVYIIEMGWTELTATIGIILTLLFGIIAVFYYFRSTNLMTAIGITKWSEISNHYGQIKFLKEAGWKM